MARIVLIMVVIALVACVCDAQLNFSTGWGKRAMVGGGAPTSGNGNGSIGATEANCKNSMEALMLIYKLIQNEAQKMIECEKFSK